MSGHNAGMNMRARGLVLTLGLLVAAGGIAQQPPGEDAATHRVLPLRGEAVLKRLLQPMPAIYAIKLSPDGTRVAYFETILQRFRTAMDSVPMTALYVVTTANGKTVRLSFDGLSDEIKQFPRSSPVLQWSHDGRQVATLAFLGGVPNLIVWDVKSLKREIAPLPTAQMITRPGEKIDSWAWLSEMGRLVVGLTSPQSTSAENKVTRSADASLKPSDVWYLSRAPQWLPTVAQTRSAISPVRRLRLEILNLGSGQSRPVQNVDDAPSFDEQALVLIGASSDGTYSAPSRFLQQREWLQGRLGALGLSGGLMQGYATMWRLDPGTATVSRIFESPTGRFYAAVPIRNGDGFVVSEGEPFPEGDPAKWPKLGLLTRLLFGHVVAISTGASAGRPIDKDLTETFMSTLFTSDRPDVMYEVMPAGTESKIFELDLSTAERKEISPVDLSVTFADVSAGGQTIAAVLESLNVPSDLYTRGHGSQRWRKLTNYAAKIGDLQVGRFEKLVWPSRDGRFSLEGLLLKPQGFDPRRKYPLVVSAHGGHWASFLNMFGWEGTADDAGSAVLPYALADAGYLVLQPNYRSTSGYSAEFSEQRPPREWYDDIDAGADAVIERGWADPRQLAFMGHSAGSAPLNFALLDPARYRAVVNNDGIYLLPEFYQLMAPAPGFGNDPAFQQDAVQDPPVDVNQFRVPLLIRWADMQGYLRHGDTPLGPETGYDVQAMVTKRLRYFMTKNNVPFEVIMDQDQHTVMDPNRLLEFQSRVLQWFDYFVRGNGANPIPAMDSPLGYVQWKDWRH